MWYFEYMISDYIEQKLKKASYKLLDDGTYFGEVKGLKGVWASASTLEVCREELQEVLEDWVVVHIRLGEKVAGLPLRFDRRKDFIHA